MADRVMNVSEAAVFFKKETGFSKATFYRYHREKISFKQISPKGFLIKESEIRRYIDSLPYESKLKSN